MAEVTVADFAKVLKVPVERVIEQVGGGLATRSAAASGMASIAGGSGVSSLRLRAGDGTLYVKRGTSWQPTATGVGVLATQQGAPQ